MAGITIFLGNIEVFLGVLWVNKPVNGLLYKEPNHKTSY
jgi:hypothetical protein